MSYGCLLLLCGRVADIIGSKKMFLAGSVWFTIWYGSLAHVAVSYNYLWTLGVSPPSSPPMLGLSFFFSDYKALVQVCSSILRVCISKTKTRSFTSCQYSSRYFLILIFPEQLNVNSTGRCEHYSDIFPSRESQESSLFHTRRGSASRLYHWHDSRCVFMRSE